MSRPDPMEAIIADALTTAGIEFTREGAGQRLDFYLPDAGVHLEVKRLHSPRIAEQMASAPDVIAVQGEVAVRWLARLILRGGAFAAERRPRP